MLKLLKFELENFMAFEYACLEFDESNIINIKGENFVGKSVINRALHTFFSFAWQKSLTSFIRDDKEFFRLRGTFESEVQVEMVKYRKSRVSYSIYIKGERVYSTEDEGNTWSANSVPEEVQKIFNVSTKEANLHYRKGRDPLLLVDTSPSENYAMITAELKATEVLEALTFAKADHKAYNRQFEGLLYNIEHTKNELVTTQNFTQDLNNHLLNLSVDLEKVGTQYQIVVDIQEYKTYLDALRVQLKLKEKVLENLPVLENYEQYLELVELHALYESKKKLALDRNSKNVLEELENLDQICKKIDTQYTLLQEVSNLCELKETLKPCTKEHKKVVGEIEHLHNHINQNLTQLDLLQEIASLSRLLQGYKGESQTLSQQIEQEQSHLLEHLQHLKKELGREARFFKCPCCNFIGEISQYEEVVFDE